MHACSDYCSYYFMQVRRQADRMVGVVLGNFSMVYNIIIIISSLSYHYMQSCSVTCGGGVRVRTALCLDQADTLFGPCGSQPCCSINSFINSTARQFLNIETCNTQACPGKSLLFYIAF